MAPFVGPDDVPLCSPLTDAELYGAVPELPADLVEADALEREWYAAGGWTPWLEPPRDCGCCTDPADSPSPALEVHERLAERFEAAFRASQQQQAAAWRAAALLHATVLAERGPLAAEHVGAELAVRMGVHPRTGMNVMMTAVRAVSEIPRLVELVEQGLISDRHVEAALSEVGAWTDDDAQARVVIEHTVEVCAERAGSCGWPTPGELRKIVQRVAILHDLQAADKKRKSVAERRGVSLVQTGAGAAALSIEGPELPLALAYRAIQERALAMAQLDGDTRSQQAREYDAAVELLTIDADRGVAGAISARPTTGLHGEPVELIVRGAHVAVVMPYSVASGGELELAEIPGLGPILPCAARQLLEHADQLRRVAVDAGTGQVLAVDDAVPGPDRLRQRREAKLSAVSEEPRDAVPAAPSGAGEEADEGPDEDPDEDPDDWPDDPPDDPPDDRPDGDHDPDGAPPSPPSGDLDGVPPSQPSGDLAAEPETSTSTELGDAPADELADEPDDEAETSSAVQRKAVLRALREALDAPPSPQPPPPLDPDPPGIVLSPDTLALLHELAARKVIWRDLNTSAYRVPGRLRRFLEYRDRTCCFPGCTVPGRYCDVDHREEWPRGGTHPDNCHVLCRRHHRAKQFYFAAVTLDPATGDTCWTTHEGHTYRRPPPRF